jgi:hypothetical protein
MRRASMGYRELPHPNAFQPHKSQLTIDGVQYDLDSFGMDDGRAEFPNAAFRFIFELGNGYFRHLYVIQAGALGEPQHFSHTFWLKGIVAVDVEMEDYGPPRSVACEPFDVPLLYTSVAVGDAAYALEKQSFVADGEALAMTFLLAGREPLVWTRAVGWSSGVLPVFSPKAAE